MSDFGLLPAAPSRGGTALGSSPSLCLNVSWGCTQPGRTDPSSTAQTHPCVHPGTKSKVATSGACAANLQLPALEKVLLAAESLTKGSTQTL